MKYFLVLAISVLFFNHSFAQFNDYQVFFGRYNDELLCRKWIQNGEVFYLSINPNTLKTSIVKNIKAESLKWDEIIQQYQNTNYFKAWRFEKLKDYTLQDAGIEKSDSTLNGFSLTVDLCPSTKPLDRNFFKQVIKAFEVSELPVPITITVTGLWMKSHQSDLKWLISQEVSGNLAITWVNHSFNHHYDPKLPLRDNFLLEKGTVIANEVLLNEQAMLQNKLIPSVYFRFPGLVSSKAIFDQILSYGLLPLGSDAWLAKGQLITKGSLVLVHANGNEPLGLKLFLSQLKKNEADIKKKAWQLWDVSNLISKEK